MIIHTQLKMFAIRKINKIGKINTNIFRRLGNLKQNMTTKSHYSNKIPKNQLDFFTSCGILGGIIGFGYGFSDSFLKNKRIYKNDFLVVLLPSIVAGFYYGVFGFAVGTSLVILIPIAVPSYILYKL